MARHGWPAENWPLSTWNLDSLTLLAIYYHPDLGVARAELAVRRAGKLTAGQIKNPVFALEPEHHSERTENSASPWTWGFLFNIPLELPGKRAARIDEAEAFSEAARLDIANTAWEVRSRLRERFVDSFEARQTADLLRRELALAGENVALLEARRKIGEAGRFETSAARLRRHQARLELDAAVARIETTRATLAEAVGMPFETIRRIEVDYAVLKVVPPQTLPLETVQRAALINRLDVRKALALYDASEAALRMEVAKQYPDLTLSPGALWDQGDVIWRLGAAAMLPVFHLNEGPIAEARARRELEAARFTALQARVLADLSRTREDYRGRFQAVQTAEELLAEQQDQFERLERQFSIGLTDRLNLLVAELEMTAVGKARLKALIDLYRAFGRIEDAVQRPMNGIAAPPGEGAVFGKPGASAPPGEETSP